MEMSLHPGCGKEEDSWIHIVFSVNQIAMVHYPEGYVSYSYGMSGHVSSR